MNKVDPSFPTYRDLNPQPFVSKKSLRPIWILFNWRVTYTSSIVAIIIILMQIFSNTIFKITTLLAVF